MDLKVVLKIGENFTQKIKIYFLTLFQIIIGKKFYQKDRFNRIIGSYEDGEYDVPKEGAQNLYLTIDRELQQYGEELFKNKKGGIVAIEPKTGEVLSLVSAPSYDPSILVGRKRSENYRKLALDTFAKRRVLCVGVQCRVITPR